MMVFGNADEKSCSGVVFTRSPVDGAPELHGEFLVNAQGEDVVAGTRTPDSIDDLPDWNEEVATQLLGYLQKLEAEYRDMQDVEFTVESGTLYLLQTRAGKRSAKAKFRIAYDLMKEKVLSRSEALQRVKQNDYLALTGMKFAEGFEDMPYCTGIAAGGGIVKGVVAWTSNDAIAMREEGKDVILLRRETTPDDLAGMEASVGIVTMTGGSTSHAAVVARSMNKTCVVGCKGIKVKDSMFMLIDDDDKSGYELWKGRTIALDGDAGKVYVGDPVLELSKPDVYAESLVRMAMKNKDVVIRNTIDKTKKVAYIDAMKFESKLEFKEYVVAALDTMPNVVIDMYCEIMLWNSDDYEFMNSVGASLDPRIDVDWAAEIPEELRDRCWVVCHDTDEDKYRKEGFKIVVQKMKSLDYLFNGHPCCLEDVSLFGSKKARKQLIDMAVKAGMELNLVPVPVEKHRLLGE